MLMLPQPAGRQQFFAADKYGAILSVPVSWNTFGEPAGIWKSKPPAITVFHASERRKVYFGPSTTSAKPVLWLKWLVGTALGLKGLSVTKPSSLMVIDNRSVTAKRACKP